MKKIKSIFAVAFIIISLLCCKKNAETPPPDNDNNTTPEIHIPAADFSLNAASGDAPLSISFTNKSSSTATSWLWDFGDGFTSSEKNPVHIYTKLGRYTLKLTVSNTDGSNSKITANAVTVYEIKEYKVSSVGPFYPKRTYGDAEFDGHGPNVKVTADLLPPSGGVSGGSESLILKLTMSAKETVSDWSTAYGEWYLNIVSLPSNATYKNFLGYTSCWQTYTDNDHYYKYSGNLQLGEFVSMGDTDGDDICSSGCGSSSTHLYFKNFYCKVRIQPK